MPVPPAKVVHVLALYPPYIGGMELRAAELVDELNRVEAGFAGVITSNLGPSSRWAPGRSGRSAPAGEEGVLRIAGFMAGRAPVTPTVGFHVLRVPRRTLIHLHVANPGSAELVWLACRLSRRPYVVQFHMDPDPYSRRGRRVLPFWKRHVLRRVLRDASVLVLPTAGYRDLVTASYGVSPERVRVIPHGTRFDQTAPPPRRGGELRVLMVSRLVAIKNVELGLEAFRRMIDGDVKSSLRIVGDGDLREELERWIEERGLARRVTLTGTLTGPELAAEYAAADCFLTSSRGESFGSTLVEAMAHGLPIVATDVRGVRDVVVDGETGLLCAEDPSALAGALARLRDDEALAERLSHNCHRALDRFRWPAIAERYRAEYRALGVDC